MELLLAAILLSAPVQEASDPHAEWLKWRQQLGTAMPMPMTQSLEMEFRLDARGFKPEEATELAAFSDIRMQFGLRTQMLDLRRFRLDLTLDGAFPEPDGDDALMLVKGSAGVTADGAALHAWGDLRLGEDGELKGGVRVTQTELEGLYTLMRDSLDEIMARSGEALSSNLMNALISFYPEQFGAYFHPCNYMLQSASMLRAREFRRADGKIAAKLAMDLEAEPIASLLAEIEQLAAETEDAEGAAFIGKMKHLIERAEITVEFDAATGAPLSGWVALEMPAQMLEVDSEGVLAFSVKFHTTEFSTASFAAERLAPPAEGFEWLDGDPFLMMAKMQLQSLAGDPSDDDLEF